LLNGKNIFDAAILGFKEHAAVRYFEACVFIKLEKLLQLAGETVDHPCFFGVHDLNDVGRAESRFQDVEVFDSAHEPQTFDVKLDKKVVAEPNQDVIFVEKHDLELDGLEDSLLFIEDKNEFIVEKSGQGFGAEIENLFFRTSARLGEHVADTVDDANLEFGVQLVELFG